MLINDLQALSNSLNGELHFDNLHKLIYATDASVYRKIPIAVAIPKNNVDLKSLINFAHKNNTTLIPRAAGTSLAGQCVGDGIIVDTSKYFNKIISFDKSNKSIIIQPGIIRDELNLFLKPHGLFFAPNTSTSNRCMIGGMVGNNSSGTTSIKYGVTRDKVTRLKAILSDGNEVEFGPITSSKFIEKTKGDSLESKIYKTIFDELSNEDHQIEIKKEFPKETIHRRNNGYAIDELLKSDLFGGTESTINLCKLLCGSEGTLAFTTEITLKLDELPPKESVMVAVHFETIQQSMEAVVVAMKHNLYLCELMDKTILDCTKNNREQLQNRFFIEGDPKAILMLELSSDSKEESNKLADNLIADLKTHNFGYAYPKLFGSDIDKAITLRKAGLGLLGNIIGDDKAVACIEDTAVEVSDLPNYIAEFSKMMEDFGQEAVYYAHAGAGEIHLRPILNLKKKEDVVLFREITAKTAKLVKKYGGSFSGEHGDGIVRAEFIPLMIGHHNYELLKRIKKSFDKNYIFNKGKIVNPYLMDESLRYEINRKEPAVNTILDFSDSKDILRATEKCNGSGDCRKLPNAGGTMCPSYRATKNEKDTTRARANALREFLTNSDKPNKFNNKELKEVFDLCLSCKACASECPSNVDIATLKAEFQYQYNKDNKPSFRDLLFANNSKYNELGSRFPRLTNLILGLNLTKRIIGFPTQRSIPKLGKYTLQKWYAKNYQKNNSTKKVYLFCDEFSNYNDVQIGIDTIHLLSKLGYEVLMVDHEESGRSMITKGFLDELKVVADKNITIFKNLISEETPLIGILPTPILTFKDEYLRIVNDKESAKNIAKNTFTIEEFIQKEIKKGIIKSTDFTSEKRKIKIHGHCHQKALIGMTPAFDMLNLPKNYEVTIINSGCCGMAGSFGFEKEHYDISMQIGEDTLFPKIRNTDKSTTIVASGTSCRHQIFDGTQRTTFHPSTVLLNALN
ncbi:FAD-binding and (Fe-S)-binding domain-containing protein [Urechidicola croceus]|uniref:FAD-binding oxidoreductase n=1 Tax=Urechidicola croceus TaxID=1850246 RepID=A0A1D8P5S1_9FLAO|nr:FAD-binding and (Fe-S)-binding domain-containing protein [Urechidicola croceus]AOW19910.1 FAD-binding oxidoreductase [Urechidicola croceus]